MLRSAKLFTFSLLAAAALGLSACATGPTVRTDHDPTANFTQYRTWGYYQPIAMEQSGYSSWISERIRADVQKEMEARGYRFAASGADLLVNFQGVVEDKTAVWSMFTGAGPQAVARAVPRRQSGHRAAGDRSGRKRLGVPKPVA